MSTMAVVLILTAVVSMSAVTCDHHQSSIYGPKFGEFPNDSKLGIKGTVYSPKPYTFYVKGFSFDESDNTTFQLGFYSRVPMTMQWGKTYDERLTNQRKFVNEDIMLYSPSNYSLDSLRDISIVGNNGVIRYSEILKPNDFHFLQIFNYGPLLERAHNASAKRVRFLDQKTVLFEKFYYDGKGPDAYFLAGKSGAPNGNGTKIPIIRVTCPRKSPKDPCIHIGKPEVLSRYYGDDVTIRLPGNLTIFDLKWISVYCIKHAHNFAQVDIPSRDELKNLPVDTIPLLDPTWKEPIYESINSGAVDMFNIRFTLAIIPMIHFMGNILF